MPDTRFIPAEHGFHFINTYLNYFIPGVTTGGRCGGMSYAALDFFFSDTPIPASQARMVKGIDVTSRDVDHLDLFAWGEDDAVWHRAYFRNGWADWEWLGGAVTSAPTATAWGVNHLDVFARGTDNALWHKNWDGSRWGDWSSVGGALSSGPDACAWGPGRVDVFARGTDDALWHIWYDGGAWHPWESLGGTLTSDPCAVSPAPGRIEVFVRGTDDAVWGRAWDGHAWSDWASHGGALASSPDAASWGGNRVDVFCVDRNRNMAQLSRNDNNWGPWTAIDGSFQGDPAAAARPGVVLGPTRLDVFGIGDDSGVWQNHFENGWHGWTPNALDVAGDTTALGDFIYRRQITSLVNQGPGFIGRLMPWNTWPTQFGWGISENDELGKLRSALDAGRPTPLGLINVEADPGKHHQVVAIGYDLGADPASTLRVRIYDPNFPDAVCTLTPDQSTSSYAETSSDRDGTVETWRTYFVDQAYQPVTPFH